LEDVGRPAYMPGHVTLVHGYLLRGTGSNVYVRSLARALCRLGIPVTLISQEPAPEQLDFVTEKVTYRGAHPLQVWQRETDYPAPCRAVRPDIGAVLPVYVWDRYPDLRAVTFQDLSPNVLQRYLQGNIVALQEEFSRQAPEVILSNHAIMQPYYVAQARAGRGAHIAILHGSALNFSVRGDANLKRYALAGLRDAQALAAPSAHSAGDLGEVLKELDQRLVVPVPPGVDLERFRPAPETCIEEDDRGRLPASLLRALEQRSEAVKGGRSPSIRRAVLRACGRAQGIGPLRRFLARVAGTYDAWAPDTDVASRLRCLQPDDALVVYFGKYLQTKGVRILLAALPLVLARRPRTRVVAVGFGEDREILEAGVALLEAGRRRLFIDYFLADAPHPALASLARALGCPRFADYYFGSARNDIRRRFLLTGIMEQDELGGLVGCADLTVAPSIFPEAFGLVAAEALAAGVIPILTAGSGFEEISRVYRDALSPYANKNLLYPLPVDEALVFRLAGRIVALLRDLDRLDPGCARSLRHHARSLAREHFGWAQAAHRLLALADGPSSGTDAPAGRSPARE